LPLVSRRSPETASPSRGPSSSGARRIKNDVALEPVLPREVVSARLTPRADGLVV